MHPNTTRHAQPQPHSVICKPHAGEKEEESICKQVWQEEGRYALVVSIPQGQIENRTEKQRASGEEEKATRERVSRITKANSRIGEDGGRRTQEKR